MWCQMFWEIKKVRKYFIDFAALIGTKLQFLHQKYETHLN